MSLKEVSSRFFFSDELRSHSLELDSTFIFYKVSLDESGEGNKKSSAKEEEEEKIKRRIRC